jgi:hypothetical protein
MRPIFTISVCAIAIALACLTGCSQEQPETAPPLYVPFSVGTTRHPNQLASGNAVQVLPLPVEEYMLVGRSERGFYGAYEVAGLSAYTEFTSDSQPIGVRPGLGYRYNYVYKNVLTVP